MIVTSLMVTSVHDKDYGRERALRKLVNSNPRLLHEFHSIEDGKYGKLYSTIDRDSIMKYLKGMDEYIKQKKFKIVNERGMMRDCGDHYRVDVSYRIEWDF